ncbi:hypothetical protein HWV62_15315 [Athelia sp. TMB]|nr:hypothetical protein HWV62_15315 [Athelia sp. TMB]
MAIDLHTPTYAASSSTSHYTVSTMEMDSGAPAYSAQPAIDERVLERTHSHYSSAPTGIFMHGNEHIRLKLKGQLDGAVAPSYDQHGVVRGDIEISCPDGVETVHVKLEGHLDMALGGIGRPASTRFFSLKRRLWTLPESRFFASPACPRRHAFDVKLPTTYRGRNLKEYPLPPSCTLPLPDSGGSTCEVRCRYTLTISVEKTPHFVLLKRKKILSVDFNYNPQMLPSQPVVPPHLTFSQTAETMPDAWHEITQTMQARYNSGIKPIQCHLYVPSTGVFGTSSPIPFHIKLSGPSASLRSLCVPNTSTSTPRALVRVRLIRHIRANSYGHQVHKALVIGEGELFALPPIGTDEILQWDGTVRCEDAVNVGGLAIDDLLSIKDFIVFNVCPPTLSSSPLVDMDQGKNKSLIHHESQITE